MIFWQLHTLNHGNCSDSLRFDNLALSEPSFMVYLASKHPHQVFSANNLHIRFEPQVRVPDSIRSLDLSGPSYCLARGLPLVGGLSPGLREGHPWGDLFGLVHELCWVAVGGGLCPPLLLPGTAGSGASVLRRACSGTYIVRESTL